MELASRPSVYLDLERRSDLAKLDQVMIRGGRKVVFESKVAIALKLTKGFYQAVSEVEPEVSFVVSRTDEIWSGGEGITHPPVGNLPDLLESYL